jgi:hypothetical protein
VPFKRGAIPETGTGCSDLLRIDFVPVLAEDMPEDRATVVKGQVVRQQVQVTSERRLGVVLVVDSVLSR